MNQSQLEQIEARLRAGDPGTITHCSRLGALPRRIRCYRTVENVSLPVMVPVMIDDDLPKLLYKQAKAKVLEAEQLEARGEFRAAAELMFDAFALVGLFRAQKLGVSPDSVATALSHWRGLSWSIAFREGAGHANEQEPLIAAGIDRDEMPKGYPELLAAAPRDIAALVKAVREGLSRETTMRSQIQTLAEQADKLRAEAAAAKVRFDRAVAACKELVAAAES